MMPQIVECVPNFSEGRDAAVIDQITAEIKSVNGVDLLSVEMGADVNRTVVTFVGSPQAVKEAAFLAIRKASQLIDMSKHKGAHPRMGATDVCPFVPVSGITMAECIEISRQVGARVGEELGIPIYLYEESASKPEWKSLANVRVGEYEALPEKLGKKEWKPDFGPAKFNARCGATAVGAREFLIAYNITLNTRDTQLAMDIAFELREKGRSVRRGNIDPVYMRGDLLKYRQGHYPAGVDDFVGKTFEETRKYCREKHGFDPYDLLKAHGSNPDKPEGWSVKEPGRFKHCRAIGWYVEEFKRAQITINLTNYKVTPPHIVLEAAREMAARRGLIVTGSEIVGLIPFPAIYEAGRYYLEKQGRSTGIPVADVIETAIFSMALDDVTPFDPAEKILGLPAFKDRPLVEMPARLLIDEVSRETPAPGGGSIAALAGALGAALGAMVANLTFGKPEYLESEPQLHPLVNRAQSVKDQLVAAVDDDTNAFNAYMEARRLPAGSDSEKTARTNAIQDGLKHAVRVPLKTAQLSFEALQLCAEIVKIGNRNSVTDAGVGAQMAFSGIVGGTLNVLINLPDITDEAFKKDMRKSCADLEKDGRSLLNEVLQWVRESIDSTK